MTLWTSVNGARVLHVLFHGLRHVVHSGEEVWRQNVSHGQSVSYAQAAFEVACDELDEEGFGTLELQGRRGYFE